MAEVQDRASTSGPDGLSTGSDVPMAVVPPVASDPTDPFLKLHKMSTTAGLGSADYVAINGMAIAAVLLGIASAFLLMGSNLLLLLPAAGIVCAILAFVQVGNSNGTQTGRGLAALGLLLSLGLGGFYVSREMYEQRRNQADTDAVVSLIHTLGQDVAQQKYDDGYALVGDHLKEHASPAQFAAAWDRFNTSKTLGGITSFDWNHLIEFGDDPVTGERVASGTVLINFKNVPSEDREPLALRKVNGKWVVEDLPQLFPASSSAPAGSTAKSSSRSEVAGPPAPSGTP